MKLYKAAIVACRFIRRPTFASNISVKGVTNFQIARLHGSRLQSLIR